MRPIAFDNTFARQLPAAGVAWKPAPAAAPRLLFANRELGAELGLDPALLEGEGAAAAWVGNALPAGAEPFAQAYAGHQFGGFSPQLGDGRALLLGEVVDTLGRRRDIAFKGSGRTPFSRGGDGKAAVGPMLREVLIGEAMHALGIPTTRALAVVATGEPVIREQPLPGAVLTRVAASHLRVGTFQYFAARGDLATLRALLAYTVARHDPELMGRPPREQAFGLLRAVARRQAALIAQWMNVGFIHGVMNTDNMTISGETIDYGPCAFMEAYDPATVFSSIDHGGRYAYVNQPAIARWNLARLAEALLPAVVVDGNDDDEVKAAVAEASAAIDEFPHLYDAALRAGQRRKLGFADSPALSEAAEGNKLGDEFLALLKTHRVDFTLGWRRLANAAEGDDGPLGRLFGESGAMALQDWLQRWRSAAGGGSDASERARGMRAANAFVIPRNHLVEAALAAASERGDLAPFDGLLQAVRRPFDEVPDQLPFAEPAPAAVTACYQTFCGT